MGYPDDLSARKLRVLNAQSWDLLVRLTDSRFRDLEQKAGLDAIVRDSVLARALNVIEEQISPVAAEARALADNIILTARELGALFSATSPTSQSVASGPKTFFIDAGLRDAFIAPAYMIISRVSDTAIWMAGTLVSYNPDNGALVVIINNFRGSGTFTDWRVSMASVPPEAPPGASADGITIDTLPGRTGIYVQAVLAEMNTDVLDNIAQIAAKATLTSPAFLGAPTAPTAAALTNTTQIATTAFVRAAVAALVASSPGALDTLDELAAALGDDPDFAANMVTALAGKASVSHNHDGVYVQPGVAQAYTAQQWFSLQTLTDAATIAWNGATQQVAFVTLGGNRTLGLLTNPQPGAFYTLAVRQDATGGRTLAFNSGYEFPGNVAPVIASGANRFSILTFLALGGGALKGVAQLDFE